MASFLKLGKNRVIHWLTHDNNPIYSIDEPNRKVTIESGAELDVTGATVTGAPFVPLDGSLAMDELVVSGPTALGPDAAFGHQSELAGIALVGIRDHITGVLTDNPFSLSVYAKCDADFTDPDTPGNVYVQYNAIDVIDDVTIQDNWYGTFCGIAAFSECRTNIDLSKHVYLNGGYFVASAYDGHLQEISGIIASAVVDDLGSTERAFCVQAYGFNIGASIVDFIGCEVVGIYYNSGDVTNIYGLRVHDQSNISGGGTHTGVTYNIYSTGLPPNHFEGPIEGDNVLRLAKMSDPSNSPANTGYIFLQDSGGGKMQLAARFPSGAVQVITTEP